MPVKGETIPPPKKVKKPSIAEAVPEFCLSRFRASVVEVGNIIPKKKRNRKKTISIMITDNSIQRATPVQQHKNINPHTPTRKACSFDRKRTTLRLPNMIATALQAKQTLYITGERW